ncbi:phosphodiester glycosidase family protein, partial [Klebsiella pneumoniae]|uniref:phosphodiester glycosidase family protein n=1 Tax=Klebsiella pneumoniae TaxID=573 RepID=UPI0025A033D9
MDGRRGGHSIGASMKQLSERLIELGCVTALCLDGGGSTMLSVTSPDATAAEIINVPSDGDRAVSNHVFLVASNRPTGQLN